MQASAPGEPGGRYGEAHQRVSVGLFRKLYHEYRRFKSSILTLLAYTSLCQCKWSHVLNYACQFEDKKLYDTSGDDAYSIEMYKVEALCQLDRIDEAYESIPKLVQHNKMNKDPIMAARDGSSTQTITQTCTTATWRRG